MEAGTFAGIIAVPEVAPLGAITGGAVGGAVGLTADGITSGVYKVVGSVCTWNG